MGTTHQKKYSAEFRERAVRMAKEASNEHPSEWAALKAVASKLGCTAEALRQWVRKSEGPSPGSAAAQEAAEQRLRELERENRELKRANEILRKASAYFAAAELDRRPR